MQENIGNIIESLLFVSEEPLTVKKLKDVFETVDTKEIQAALHALAEQYETRGGGFKLAEVAGGWQLRSRAEYHQWIKRMLQPSPQRLSKAALETLAIVAYNQPIIRADIEHIRGVDSGGVLRQLLERKLIRVLGRKEIPGRPLIYATTKLFLELFELKDLQDLPSPKEIEEMSKVTEPLPTDPISHFEPLPEPRTTDIRDTAPQPHVEKPPIGDSQEAFMHDGDWRPPDQMAAYGKPIIANASTSRKVTLSAPSTLPFRHWTISIARPPVAAQRPDNLPAQSISLKGGRYKPARVSHRQHVSCFKGLTPWTSAAQYACGDRKKP
jgi:segregation and condensation protein B